VERFRVVQLHHRQLLRNSIGLIRPHDLLVFDTRCYRISAQTRPPEFRGRATLFSVHARSLSSTDVAQMTESLKAAITWMKNCQSISPKLPFPITSNITS
jgi:hypothetical protein